MRKVNYLTSATVIGIGIVLASAIPAKAISITNFDNFNLNGSTTKDTANDDLILTNETDNDQAGSAFDTNSISINENTSFTSEFNFDLSADNDDGADGMTFMLQNDSKGETALGDSGSELGYGDSDSSGNSITNSLAIEFDTFKSEPDGTIGDPNDNHIGVNLNGSVVSEKTASPSFNLNNGEQRTALIEYDGSTDSLTVSINGTELLTDTVDLFAETGDSAFVGFSAGTGSEKDEHRINSINFETSEPVPFEAEGAMGLVALGGYLSYRYCKKRKQALSQESNV